MAKGTAATSHTPAALNKWSVAGAESLPDPKQITDLHVYDFDNTLFNTSLPNAKIWNGPSIGSLQREDLFSGGGWWHDSRILAATGDGVEAEEPRAWEGWWNETIVELVRLSMVQKDAITILLTGRSVAGYTDLLKRMLASKGLVFDMVVLKPKSGPAGQELKNTMQFKQIFLEHLMETYMHAEEIRLYEDRVKHVKVFREFFMDYNKKQQGIGGRPTRNPIVAEVIEVADGLKQLDPVREVAAITSMIADHNAAIDDGKMKGKKFEIKRTVFYTGYLITAEDTKKLIPLAGVPQNMPDSEVKFLANNILITPRPAPQSILDKVGGLGNKLLWEVTGTACFESRVWAASVRPVPSTAKYYSENPAPLVVLALRKNTRPIDANKIQNWQPVPQDKQIIFETTVGEKQLLRIEELDSAETSYESLFPNKALKRKHEEENETPKRHNNINNNQRHIHQPQNQAKGNQRGNHAHDENSRSRGRGGNRGARDNDRGRARGRGGRGGNTNHSRPYYDDPPPQTQNHGNNYGVNNYDDYPPLGQHAPARHQQGYQQQGGASGNRYQEDQYGRQNNHQGYGGGGIGGSGGGGGVGGGYQGYQGYQGPNY